ncbi:MAG: PilN domain-containing protein [Bdellovibrionales bacterium]|nr:PilN domain-containing protein [Bdellovibrionales bacterium]
MIKVNLVSKQSKSRSTSRSGRGEGPKDFAESAQLGVSFSQLKQKKNLILNLLIILSLPVGLIYYERQEINKLKNKSNLISAEVADLDQALNNKKTEIENSSTLKEKAKELTNKISILKKLARLRIREIKAIDFIQGNIPEKVWLKDLNFKNGELKIHGRATTDDELSAFIHSLEKSKYFSGVLLLQAKEERSVEGSIKSFEISCSVEVD